MEKIYFYGPSKQQQELLEKDYRQWVFHHSNFTPWIGQTYFNFKKAGLPCEIATKMPTEGIILADRDTLGNSYPFLEKLMLICAKSDREYHPSAHIHITHNINDFQQNINSIWFPYYLQHWPMSGIIPRQEKRGSLIENIAYIGSKGQLDQVLLSSQWIDKLKDIGCNWLPIFQSNKWNDYSNIDVIVAVRDFQKKIYINKGAIKLINAWLGKVPAILAPESGFLAVRKSELDFLMVNSLDETIEAIKMLKNDPQLYLSMIKNGQERVQEFSQEKITQDWINFFENYAFPEYKKWIKMSDLQRRSLFFKRYFRLKIDRMKTRLKLN